MDRADVVSIGAGLVGAALAFDLATRGVCVVVLAAGRELAAAQAAPIRASCIPASTRPLVR